MNGHYNRLEISGAWAAPHGYMTAVIGNRGFLHDGETLYVRLLCPNKHGATISYAAESARRNRWQRQYQAKRNGRS